MRFYNFRNFRTNFVLVFIHLVCYQSYYVFSSYVALSIRDIFYFLSTEMEYCASAASMLAEEIWQIAEGFVEVLRKYVGSI